MSKWKAAVKFNGGLKIRSYYATSSPKNGSLLLQNALPAQARAIRSNAYGDHCEVPMVDFGDALTEP